MYFKGDPYLTSDAVFGVKSSLIVVRFVLVAPIYFEIVLIGHHDRNGRRGDAREGVQRGDEPQGSEARFCAGYARGRRDGEEAGHACCHLMSVGTVVSYL